METTTHIQPATKTGSQEFFESPFVKVGIMTLLILVMLIPLASIQSLISERRFRQLNFQSQLNTEWGGQVDYYGIALRIPQKGKNGQTLYIYPSRETDRLGAEVKKKHRGIYTSQIYHSSIASSAEFDWKDIADKYGKRLQEVQICLVTDVNSRLTSLAPLVIDGKPLEIAGSYDAGNKRIFYTPLPAAEHAKLQVETHVAINGNSELTVHPLAAVHTMTLQSNWQDPAFEGNLLPASTSFEGKLFTSSWKSMNVLNGKNVLHGGVVSPAHATIRFIEPVDFYQLNERTIKYGILVLSLTFAVFFLIEITNRMRINPIHYVLIGLGLLLFYLLLLSFSEQIGFIGAYIVAAVSIIALIGWYSKSILHSTKFASLISVSLVLLYTFLIVIVHLEVYALIAGSIGLLVVLFLIMSVTRKLTYTPTT